MVRLIKTTLILLITLCTTFSYSFQTESEKPNSRITNAIKVSTEGNGSPILFLPGFTVSGLSWRETYSQMQTKGKAYYFSYAGFNGNNPIKMPWYSSVKNAIIEYIKKNDLNNMIIIGHSMGGNLAIDVASELPHKVNKIILVDSLPCMREVMMPNVKAEHLFYESPYTKQMLEMDENQFKEMTAMMASNMTNNKTKAEEISNWILEADRKTWVYGYIDLLKLDQRTILKKIQCKTLIIGASFPSIDIAQKNFEKQYDLLENKSITMASNSKHFVMFDQPEWFNQTLNNFLANDNQ
ncbi:Pimeloyl-ACP methyl ester carboxylesterase [Tenacibaculum sp. MAR_2009_124]|uniref:alpha/beta fold hydrolase n=1 Tax=Tenacibaculum sp. MAR_2009_124 TaxID=1250059 RepID=UPI00089524C9|nr:alpha/beta hydrolase [Tenacibaculum sp. MAR_2009_124]SEB36700.1 Pimeloyl-ACP methyl ester carboxylesterase [Tenacibaculum sp. MAR_2009_124]